LINSSAYPIQKLLSGDKNLIVCMPRCLIGTASLSAVATALVAQMFPPPVVRVGINIFVAQEASTSDLFWFAN
jgi:hypothetical protein